jgi:hypothetical protein
MHGFIISNGINRDTCTETVPERPFVYFSSITACILWKRGVRSNCQIYCIASQPPCTLAKKYNIKVKTKLPFSVWILDYVE